MGRMARKTAVPSCPPESMAGCVAGGESAVISGLDTGKSVEMGYTLFQHFQLGPEVGGGRGCRQSCVDGAQPP